MHKKYVGNDVSSVLLSTEDSKINNIFKNSSLLRTKKHQLFCFSCYLFKKRGKTSGKSIKPHQFKLNAQFAVHFTNFICRDKIKKYN